MSAGTQTLFLYPGEALLNLLHSAWSGTFGHKACWELSPDRSGCFRSRAVSAGEADGYRVDCCQGNRLPRARPEECWGRSSGCRSISADDQLGRQWGVGKTERTQCPAEIPSITISSRTQPRERPAKGVRQPGAREDQAHESFVV